MLRFHLDEHIAAAIATALRQIGIEVSMSFDAKLIEAADKDHLKYAFDEGRVIVTHDHDFIRLNATETSHAGIAYYAFNFEIVGRKHCGSTTTECGRSHSTAKIKPEKALLSSGEILNRRVIIVAAF